MPELPDVTVYIESLAPRIVGQRLERVRLASPFLLRTVEPPLTELFGRRVHALRRLGKRIVVEFDGDLFLVIHLMIAGRLRWRPSGTKVPGKLGLAAFDFSSGTLLLTEASSRASAPRCTWCAAKRPSPRSTRAASSRSTPTWRASVPPCCASVTPSSAR